VTKGGALSRDKVLAYSVTFDGVSVPNLGPHGGPRNHELIVIVNAVIEKYVEAFSYR
jgi:hypothetical protein